MDKYLFNINSTDSLLIQKVKTEGNIILSSVIKKHGADSVEFANEESKIDLLISLFNTIDSYNILSNDTRLNILDEAKSFIKTNLLSSLTLNDDEFQYLEEDEHCKWYENKRYPYIEKLVSPRGVEYRNHRAFNCIIKAEYNHVENRQIDLVNNYLQLMSPHVYITKGGVISGLYIQYSWIQINRSFDHVTTPINLPVSLIKDNKTFIYTVDAREPKLLELKSKYNVEFQLNNNILGKYDIRKYKKLNK